MSVWRRGPLSRNPYARTAFRTARVPRETLKHRTVTQLIGQTKKVVKTDAQAHLIGGRPVTEEELNLAEQILLDPRRRVVEELLEHATERPYVERIRKLLGEAKEAMADGAEPPPITSLQCLAPLAGAVVARFLDAAAAEAPDPAFGALELDLCPPFGPLEEE